MTPSPEDPSIESLTGRTWSQAEKLQLEAVLQALNVADFAKLNWFVRPSPILDGRSRKYIEHYLTLTVSVLVVDSPTFNGVQKSVFNPGLKNSIKTDIAGGVLVTPQTRPPTT